MSLTYTAIDSATLSKATSWILTSTGVFVDTETITIGGVVLKTVNALSVGPAVPGEVVIGASAAATLTNLAAAINNPLTSSSTFTALSVENAYLFTSIYGLHAVATATTLTITSSTKSELVVSETESNAAWSSKYTSPAIPTNQIGKTAIQFIASGVSTGNGVFTVDVSNDDVNWVAYNRLTTNVTNTNTQSDTRVASVTLNSNTSAMVTFPENDNPEFFRVSVVPSIDGVYSAIAFVS